MTLLVLTGVLAACADRRFVPARMVSLGVPAAAATNTLAGTPMAVYGRALNRAKSVQNIVNSQADKQAKDISTEQSGN